MPESPHEVAFPALPLSTRDIEAITQLVARGLERDLAIMLDMPIGEEMHRRLDELECAERMAGQRRN